MKEDTNNTTLQQKEISEKMADLVLNRVIAKINSRLTEAQRQELEEVFSSSDDNLKVSAMKKYAPDFKEMLEQETIVMAQKLDDKVNKKLHAK